MHGNTHRNSAEGGSADRDSAAGGSAAGGRSKPAGAHRNPAADDLVEQDMFTVLHGQPAPVVTKWLYRTADPYAVTIAVRVGDNRWVEWLVARDLVIESLTGPAGVGDIRMSPQIVQEYEIVEIEISSADGRAVLEVDRDLLTHFVSSTLELVPPGGETDRVDIDREIAKITQGCWE